MMTSFVAALVVALPVSAEITNGCIGSLAGQDVGARSSADPNQAIQVQWDQSVTAQVRSAAPITGYHVDLEFAGIPFTVAHGGSNGNSWSQPVEVRQYAIYGVGLYKVIGTSTGPGACSASFLVNIVGRDPLSTPVGQAAAAVLAIGALGTVAATLSSAAGTPVHARRYVADLQAVENNSASPATLEPYYADAVNVNVDVESYHYVPDAISVQSSDVHDRFIPDTESAQPADDFHYVPDAVDVGPLEAPTYHSDAIDVGPLEAPTYHSDAIDVGPLKAPAAHGDVSDIPGPPPRRGV